MYSVHPINSYYRVPIAEVFKNLTPDFRSHLRSIFGCTEDCNIEMEFGSGDELIFHFRGNV